jgi:hypothetical protein
MKEKDGKEITTLAQTELHCSDYTDEIVVHSH